MLRRSSHEPTKVQDIQFPQVARHEAVATPIEPIFLDAEEFAVSERSESLPLSPGAMLISSAIAENASSHLNQSSEGSGRPSSPDFIVSPNPMSPAGAAIPAPATRYVGFASISNGQESSPVSPRDFKTAFATPVSAVPESSNTSSLTSNRQLDRSGASLYPSRLADVAELRNDKLCIQIFSFWRSQVMKDKIDNLRGQLTAAGRASELILAENAKLKARVAELEHAITVVHSAPEVESHTVSTGSEDLSMSMPHQLPPSSFESPRPSQTAINFVTPPSHTSPLRHSGFVSVSHATFAHQHRDTDDSDKHPGASTELGRVPEALIRVAIAIPSAAGLVARSTKLASACFDAGPANIPICGEGERARHWQSVVTLASVLKRQTEGDIGRFAKTV